MTENKIIVEKPNQQTTTVTTSSFQAPVETKISEYKCGGDIMEVKTEME